MRYSKFPSFVSATWHLHCRKTEQNKSVFSVLQQAAAADEKDAKAEEEEKAAE